VSYAVDYSRLTAVLCKGRASRAEMSVVLTIARLGDGAEIGWKELAREAGCSTASAQKGVEEAIANKRLEREEVRSVRQSKAANEPRWRFRIPAEYLCQEMTMGRITTDSTAVMPDESALSDPMLETDIGAMSEVEIAPMSKTDTPRARVKGTSSPESLKPVKNSSATAEERGASAPAPAPNGKPVKAPAPVRGTADRLYRDLTNRWLPVEVRDDFEAALVRYGEQRFRDAVKCWRAASHKPTNYKGQLDWMRKGVPERHRIESDVDYEAKAGQAPAKVNGNGYTTKADRNRERLRELAEDIHGIGRGGAVTDLARHPRQSLPGDEPGAADARGADAGALDVGGDRDADPDLEAQRLLREGDAGSRGIRHARRA
jgi:hypothetical protein